ncbi:Phospholipase D/Transphosphatidylase,PLD-like domain [Cinara cedri]|uniref:Phospholipase D/Transphosphatidylase,PLD-like domain n=1 Tax=Cinara cedri TaxID=506608 RepID=A0A5E4MFI9_9HEMI|nr:Phospholipase D/Transphosphatidylase,PLD-like domain [Cinara cedri]
MCHVLLNQNYYNNTNPRSTEKAVSSNSPNVISRLVYNKSVYFGHQKNCLISHGLMMLVALLFIFGQSETKNPLSVRSISDSIRVNSCQISLCESMPIGMTYENNAIVLKSTYQTWMDLIHSAKRTIEIASLYWTLNDQDFPAHDGAQEGKNIFNALLEAGRDRNLTLKIARNIPFNRYSFHDINILQKDAHAQVVTLNFTSLWGNGVLHTKFWLIDRTHFYVGSANMDWRSLTQIKEIGVVGTKCSILANDVGKIFDVYWQIGKQGKIPANWPDVLRTKINISNPLHWSDSINNKYSTFISSSPAQLSPSGRTSDLSAILYCINEAKQFIYISVMYFCPLRIYSIEKKFWPDIDNALKSAAINKKITIRILISKWKSVEPFEDIFLTSLAYLNNSFKNVTIEVKKFIVPTNSSFDNLPYARVKHDKFMVTDKIAYVGTSNWSEDYFIKTAGVGIVFKDVDHWNNNTIRDQLEEVFLRDWNSKYVFPLNVSNQPIP